MTHTLCLRLQNGSGYAESGKETRGELIVKWWVVRCDATHPHLGTVAQSGARGCQRPSDSTVTASSCIRKPPAGMHGQWTLNARWCRHGAGL
jgi:hypothetical protein